jgi:hypothetical protein
MKKSPFHSEGLFFLPGGLLFLLNLPIKSELR